MLELLPRTDHPCIGKGPEHLSRNLADRDRKPRRGAHFHLVAVDSQLRQLFPLLKQKPFQLSSSGSTRWNSDKP